MKLQISNRISQYQNMADYEFDYQEFKTFLLDELLPYFGKSKSFVIEFLNLLITPKTKHRNKLWSGKIQNLKDTDSRWYFCHSLWLLIQQYDTNHSRTITD